MHSKVEAMAYRDREKNTVFTITVAVHIPKYIHGQYLCQQANVGIAKWKLWRASLEKCTLYLLLLRLFVFPNIFVASTSMKKEM